MSEHQAHETARLSKRLEQRERPLLLVLDDKQDFLDSLCAVLDDLGHRALCTTNPDEALAAVRDDLPAVVICDYRMPRTTGTSFLDEVRQIDDLPVRVLYSAQPDYAEIVRSQTDGQVYRYLDKYRFVESLAEHLSDLLGEYGRRLDAAVAMAALGDGHADEGEEISIPAEWGLTQREQEVALLAAEGYTTANIAARLDVAEPTVNTHLRRVYRKAGVGGRTALAWKVLKRASDD